MATVLALVAIAVTLNGAAGLLTYLDLRKRLNYLMTAERISAAQREQEAQIKHQKSARVHKLSPPVRQLDGAWRATCSCSWISSSWVTSESCLDEMEQHKNEMLLRRTG